MSAARFDKEQESAKQERSRVGSIEASEAREEQKPELPLEWRGLARFIEPQRDIRPAPGYIDTFWNRIRPRLHEAARQQILVREYLRQTFWRRWLVRTAAILAFGILTVSWFSQRKQIREMHDTLAEMRQQVELLQAGM